MKPKINSTDFNEIKNRTAYRSIVMSANSSKIQMKKIAIMGFRGIPAKYGGFETFAEELSTGLVLKV